MKPKRLISLLVAVCMMITMLPLSAVTAFAADTSTVRTAIVDGYKYEYTINTEDDTATIKYFRGPVDSEGNVDSANNGPYDIDIPSELDHHPVTGLGAYSFSGMHFSECECHHPYTPLLPSAIKPFVIATWSDYVDHSTKRYFHRSRNMLFVV